MKGEIKVKTTWSRDFFLKFFSISKLKDKFKAMNRKQTNNISTKWLQCAWSVMKVCRLAWADDVLPG